MTQKCFCQDIPAAPDRKLSIAGVVVLYHPTDDVLENIRSYLEQVDILFAVDNSESVRPELKEQLTETGKVVYIANHENQGIARGLNIGAQLAIERGCNFLLTMDQDSSAAPGMVGKMLDCLGSIDSRPVGIISPFHATRPGEQPSGKEDCREVLTAMTSGNLLNLQAYETVGPFLDILFIDFIDIEYCLRLQKAGFRVILATRALLQHQVGTKIKFSVFSKDVYLTSHDALRKYYKTRNRFFVADRYKTAYPRFCRADRIRFVLELLRLLLFEREKMQKLSMMYKGYADYRRGKLGKFKADNGVELR